MADEAKAAEAKVAETVKAGTEAGDAQVAEKAKEDPEIPDAIKAYFEKRIQSAEDKVRTKYSKELKEKDAALEAVKKEKMTADEQAKYEIEKREQAIAEKEKLVTQAQLKSYASDRLADLDIGREALDLLTGDSEEAIDGKVKLMKAILAKHRQLVGSELMKGNGRVVQQSNMAGTQLFSKEQLRAMTQSQVDAIYATAEGEKKINASYAAAAKR